MNPKFNASEAIVDALNPIYHLTQPFNLFNWMDRVGANSTNYVDKSRKGDYDQKGNIRRGGFNKWRSSPRGLVEQEAQNQINQYIKNDPEGRKLSRGAKNYGIDVKDDNDVYQRLDTLVEEVGIGDDRYAQLSLANLPISALNLPKDQNFATVPLPVFDNHLQRAIQTNKVKNSLVEQGIDPSSVKSRAEANEAIRKKGTADEIEKQTALEDAYEGSKKGQREAASHQSGLDLINQQISSSKAATALNNKIATNNQTQQNYVNDTDAYRYEDNKIQRGLDRKYEADREDAKFAAQLQNVKLQNAAEMERYELMLQNDREVRQGDNISDLMAALTVLSGSFLI
jgi:hypothetical protein